ncbi:MAG TPA: hypothetical protein PLO52_03425 [Flavobacterium alvei]|nr:hypothetical protein [Flavobacterium alvei]HQF47248.1 hypothetical protein [Flavobacterium alvei]HQK39150.1 hypothetical protein [Flavobacterium alvei]
MKSKLSLLIILLISNISFSQDKKELFYDYNLTEISKEKFITLKNKDNYALSYENENSIKTYLAEIKTSGKLNFHLLETIKKYLVDLDPKTSFAQTNFIVINYIDNDPSIHTEGYQVPWNVFTKDISKSFKKSEKVTHFYIINPDVKDLYYYHGNKLNWKTDKDHFIKDKFFPFKLNGGFLIIDKNGNYISYKGEYSKKDVLEKLKEMKEK